MSVLNSALRDHVTTEPGQLAFALQVPAGRTNLFVLLDHSGFILGRSRRAEDCLAILGSHLAAFAPAPPATTRLTLRAIVRDDQTALLAAFPLFADPPLVERQLRRESCRLLDRLAIDLSPDGTISLSTPIWPDLTSRHHTIEGHIAALPQSVTVDTLLVPRFGSGSPTTASAIASIAQAVTRTLPITDRLDFAEGFVDTCNIVDVGLNERSTRYRALRK